jgi:hypothetical protein
VIEFVEECRREWRRLRVPEPVANEMAADLEADLDEAAAEGVAAEEVLGSSAFDPRSFAARWAAERGVLPRATARRPRRPVWVLAGAASWRWLLLAALVGSGLVALLGAALVAFRHGAGQMFIPAFGQHATGPARLWIAQALAGPPRYPDARAGVFLLALGLGGLIVSILLCTPWMTAALGPRGATRAARGQNSP